MSKNTMTIHYGFLDFGDVLSNAICIRNLKLELLISLWCVISLTDKRLGDPAHGCFRDPTQHLSATHPSTIMLPIIF